MLVTARKLITGPTTEPLDVDGTSGVYTHSRIFSDQERAYVQTLIKVAREWLEVEANLALITQTWDFYTSGFWTLLEVPRSPLQSVTSITYIDDDGDEQTVDASTYLVHTEDQPGTITLAPDYTWPVGARAQRNGVRVRAVCGCGDDATDVPEAAIHALRLMVADMYEHRETVITGTIVSRIPTLDRLIRSIEVPESA